ncbi:prion-inhibition and propagation-domain-containing protein [Penicillium cataractarum]|uniref:Prion-inhibition and propagation-domain-containing protein n=1 Tax=Penicillium cataractarum TaxID=2100454 RepID=A0A9W9S0Y8_9EURO|nr:prion-inhibition and propagation-domain-containing protein [Penicillium cataractarum]KAJ5370021.1 prion-inhibition and propagation-domain-containing protein [Penicillium cataractarum]
MDPATASGLAIGVVSLAFDLFDNSVKLFKFFSSMVDMPKECEQCRLQLMIEYNRLLAWGDAVGLIDVPKGSHIAVSLGTNAIELCGIISRIAWLLGEFKELNARWQGEFTSHLEKGQVASKAANLSIDVTKEISSLAMAYEKTQEERKNLRGKSHIIKWISKRAGNAKEIVTHPFRVRWVMVDKEAFEALLQDLHVLIQRIYELMGDYRERRIHEITASSYREMVIIRNDVMDLRNMLDAVTSLIKTSRTNDNCGVAHTNDNDETLRDLLRLKEINHISDSLLRKMRDDANSDIDDDLRNLISVKFYDADTLNKNFCSTRAANTKNVPTSQRSRGSLRDGDRSSEVWIEWKPLQNIIRDSVQDKESRVRTAILAQMLHVNKPRHLYSPKCVGFIDDREQNKRYGWIFEMPAGSDRDSSLKSLHSILGTSQFKPTLTQRISLAWKLASSLLYLHTTSWIHKGIHSGNIIFAFNGQTFDIEKPILSGFEYSRPQSGSTTTRSPNPQWDIYRWPGIQGEAPNSKNSRKTYDIYSLGLVLLEVAHWKPLHKIMCLKKWPEPSHQDARIRAWLLKEELFPPFKDADPLKELRDIAGDKYWRAVSRCIVAHGEMGMHLNEEDDQARDSELGIKLQKTFTALVVEELKGVSI